MRSFSDLLQEISLSEKVLFISIQPGFSRLIFQSGKTVEFRRRVPRVQVRFAVVYESSPTKAIVGFLSIKEPYHICRVKDLQRLVQRAQVEQDFFDTYFEGCDLGVGIEIEHSYQVEKNIDLKLMRDELGLSPPQSFMYLSRAQIEQLASMG